MGTLQTMGMATMKVNDNNCLPGNEGDRRKEGSRVVFGLGMKRGSDI